MLIVLLWSAILYFVILGNFINHELKDLLNGKEIEEEFFLQKN